MSISRNYYLRRAFELEKIARQCPSPAMQGGLEELAQAFRTLAKNETTRTTSPLNPAEIEVGARNLVSRIRTGHEK